MPKKTPAPSHAPLASTAADLRRLRDNSAATGAELRHFLESIRGTSPAEALGALAQSSLVRSTLLSAIILAAILALTTLIPHLLSSAKPAAPEAGQDPSTAAATPPATLDEPADPADTGSPATSPAAAVPPDSPPDPAATANTLGIGEQRDAPANVNPLESLADDLLKDLE